MAGGQTDDDSCTKRRMAQYKITRLLLTVIGVFYLVLTPYFVATALRATYAAANVPTAVRIMQGIAITIFGVNPAVNPVIYAKQNPKFMEAFKQLVQCK